MFICSQTLQHSNSLLGQSRFNIPFSTCDHPRNELQRTRYTIWRALVTYTMSMYVKTEKITTTPKTLSFCCLRWGVECKKNLRIPGSLSLLRWRREREERSEGVGPWSGPTTPVVISNHPGYHMLPYLAALYYEEFPAGPACRACWKLLKFSCT